MLPPVRPPRRMLAVNASLGSTVSYDRGYDEASRSLTSVACSDGENGLLTRFGWEFQGSTPQFPNIGGVPAVGGWNSPNVRPSTTRRCIVAARGTQY